MKNRPSHSEIDPAQCLEAAAAYLREGRFMMGLECLDQVDAWLYDNEGKPGAAAIRRRLLELDREARRMMDRIMEELPFGRPAARAELRNSQRQPGKMG